MESQVLQALLETGVRHGASDIHFRPGAPPMYRVNKQLVPLKTDALTPEGCAAIAQVVGGRQFQKLDPDDIQDFDTSYSIPNVARFRVNIYRQRGSICLVLRIIPSKIPTIKELGLPPVIQKIAENERGMVLVTGATGSGKSTTLAAMIDHINQTRMDHILTIEDPIEFLHKHQKASISQREIGPDTPSFAAGLKAALRQDPDVILVGEMRDNESIDIALKAAETGHLVFSTVHTTDAAKTVGRIVSTFPAEQQPMIRMRLAENLQATISQRLLPRADGQGMVVACEVMICTAAVREVLMDPSQGNLKDLIEQGRQHYNMQSFDQHLVYLFKKNLITKQTALRAATSPSDFERNLSFS
jgi:twitching motility protein PilT